MTTRKIKKEKRPFGGLLTSLMKDKKMTLKQAAEIAGTSQSTISDWRNGASPENYEAVQRLANHLGVSLSFILTGQDDVVDNKMPSVSEVFEESDMFFDGYAKITIQRLIPRAKKK
jgi:transcriptional regulator with XRE-family HTH domain